MAQNSDPLPFTQVDRAVRPKATALAGFIGTSPQHALGSLIDFWELCGDPREIERLLEKGIDEVILPPDEISGRFEIASGKMVDPKRLVTLGLLEARDDGNLRVRGMSRYFEPIRRRLQARAAARAGGLASAKARKEAHGTAQPRSEGRSGSGSESAQATAQADVEATPKRRRSEPRSDAEAAPEAAPNTEDRGQRSSLKSSAPASPPPASDFALRPSPASVREMGDRRSPDPTFRALTDALAGAWAEKVGGRYEWVGGRDGDALKALRGANADAEIVRLWRIGIALPSKDFRAIANLGQLRSKWNDLAKEYPPPKPKPKPISTADLLAEQEREATARINAKKAAQ